MSAEFMRKLIEIEINDYDDADPISKGLKAAVKDKTKSANWWTGSNDDENMYELLMKEADEIFNILEEYLKHDNVVLAIDLINDLESETRDQTFTFIKNAGGEEILRKYGID